MTTGINQNIYRVNKLIQWLLLYISSDQRVWGNISASLHVLHSPGLTNQSHMSDSFHHSILLSYQWHHLLLVGALCFRAMMLFLCRASIPHADNNHKAGRQWNDLGLFHVSTRRQWLNTYSVFSQLVFLSNTRQVHFLVINCRRRDYAGVVVVKSGCVWVCQDVCFWMWDSSTVPCWEFYLHYAN